MLYIFLIPIVVISLLALPVVYAIKTKKSFKKAILGNVCTFAAVMIAFIAAAPTVIPAVAAETAAPAAESVQAEESTSADGMRYLAAALAVGLGSIGGGLAVAAAAPAAIGAVSEDPKSFSKALIFVALGEGCALYGFIVALLMIFI